MKLALFIEFLRARIKLLIRVCLGVLALLIVADAVLVDKEHAHTTIEHLPAFWSVFGFLGCAVIILASKWFGHTGIMTREDYYDE
ncbi:MAG TPA: hypothetical protein VKY92_06265 [Verrucomicrobiae bacterium]|nr:hypothetical protein [Verrucomicrobiae bacterium]